MLFIKYKSHRLCIILIYFCFIRSFFRESFSLCLLFFLIELKLLHTHQMRARVCVNVEPNVCDDSKQTQFFIVSIFFWSESWFRYTSTNRPKNHNGTKQNHNPMRRTTKIRCWMINDVANRIFTSKMLWCDSNMGSYNATAT